MDVALAAADDNALYLRLNPIAAMVLGIILLGEALTTETVVGMALVLVGILVGSGAFPARRPEV